MTDGYAFFVLTVVTLVAVVVYFAMAVAGLVTAGVEALFVAWAVALFVFATMGYLEGGDG